MILVNEMTNEESLSTMNFKKLVILLAPFAPFISEEIWSSFKESVHNQVWPEYDPKLIKEEIISLIVQINGKLRDKIEVESDISEDKAKELAISSKKIKNWVEGKEIKKVIFVPGKLINIVI
jgi:leucyl-tRNA synthetase